MFTSLKKLATQAGLRTDDEGEGTTPTPPVTTSQAPVTHSAPQLSVMSPSAQYSQSMGIANPEMVRSIKESVLKASPVISMFIANCELMRKAIPHDETIRMRAALAMMANVGLNGKK